MLGRKIILESLNRVPGRDPQIEIFSPELQFAITEAAHVEQIVDQYRLMARLPLGNQRYPSVTRHETYPTLVNSVMTERGDNDSRSGKHSCAVFRILTQWLINVVAIMQESFKAIGDLSEPDVEANFDDQQVSNRRC
jgi:hypothetical protein